MKHCISIQPSTDYGPLVNLIASECGDADVRNLTNEVDGNGDPYQLVEVWTLGEVSEKTERDVDRFWNVIVSTFNIEE